MIELELFIYSLIKRFFTINVVIPVTKVWSSRRESVDEKKKKNTWFNSIENEIPSEETTSDLSDQSAKKSKSSQKLFME